MLKGRTNYACLLKVRDQVDADQGALIPAGRSASATGPRPANARVGPGGRGAGAAGVGRATELEADGLADRDEAPSHTERGWQQVSIPVRECLGVQRCPQGANCFVEKSREHARAADLIVTNHALLAIDAMHGGTALPEHDAVIIDEAHELVARVTGAASAELSPQAIERVARRVLSYLEDELALEFLESADVCAPLWTRWRWSGSRIPESALITACRQIVADHPPRGERAVRAGGEDRSRTPSGRRRGQGAVRRRRTAGGAVRRTTSSGWPTATASGARRGCAPLSVAGLLRERVFAERTVILTSATLKLGGDFDGMAARSACGRGLTRPVARTRSLTGRGPRRSALAWRGLDVGSPFDYREAGHPLHGALAGSARAATGCQSRRWPRSPNWSGPRAVARWVCSRPGARRRRPRCSSASNCRS